MKNLLLFFVGFLFPLSIIAQTQVPVYYAKSSRPSQPGQDIYKCLDGDSNTDYHTKWYTNGIPDTLDFYFYNVKSINEIVYNPRLAAKGSNGIWRSVDVYHTTVDQPNTFVKDFSQNLANDNNAKTLSFASPIIKPNIIRIIVTNGVGGFSACSELNFLSADPSPVEIDPSCDLVANDVSSLADTKLTISSASANTAENSAPMSKLMDGDYNTIYHSRYNPSKFVVSASNPAILTFNFAATAMDYLVYYPRQDGNYNGRFGEFEVLYKLSGQSAYTSLLTYDAQYSGSPSIVRFPTQLSNVVSIQIKVKTAGNDFASCAEMEFYRIAAIDYAALNTVFKDDLLTGLKTGVTQTAIDALTIPFFKDVANCMKAETYNYRFRIQDYTPYLPVNVLASQLKTSTYNSYENPTGIFFEAGSNAVLIVGEQADNFSIALTVADFRVHNGYVVRRYPLKSGINIIPISTEGIGYIDYYTTNTSATPVKIHIATGKVSGMIDAAIDGPETWLKVVNNAVYPQIDLKGKYMNTVFHKDLLRKYNPTDIRPLIAAYDTIAKIQFNMMGLKKYNIEPKNHMFAFAHSGGGLYAGGMGMHFDYTWGESSYISVDGLFKGDTWGVAHEIGHVNQVRPGLRWVGMTEVTNNIYSTYTAFTLGPTRYKNARLENEYSNPFEGDTVLAPTTYGVVGGRYKGFLRKAFIHKTNLQDQNVFAKAVVFWQLQLYYQFAGALKGAPTLQQRVSGEAAAPAPGQPDYAYWLGDVMNRLRNRNDSGVSHGQLMLNFVKDVCDVVQEDLTDYFVKVGMLKEVDMDIDDYGVRNFKITQAQVDQTISDIKAKGYAAPVSPVLYYLSANSLDAFKNKVLVSGTYGQGLTINNAKMNISHSVWKNVVVFETYDNLNNLIGVDMVGTGDADNQSTTIDFPAEADKVYAVAYDGSKTLVYSKVLPVDLLKFDAVGTTNGALLNWETASEANNKLFEVWKSTNGQHFVKIAEIAGKGNSLQRQAYTYLDKSFNQSAYYKLVQVDFDGRKREYNEQIKYVEHLNKSSLKIYPNPVQNNFWIQVGDGILPNKRFELLDVSGKLVKQFTVNNNETKEIDCSSLASGLYLLRYKSLGGTQIEKIIKQ